MLPDTDQIALALRVLAPGGSVRELRVPKTRHGTLCGYFDDPERFAAEAARVASSGPGTYFTLNPVNPDLLARADNRVVEYAQHTSADTDIVSREWLLVDADPVRPSGISSTDAEHEAALTRVERVMTWLLGIGFTPAMLVRADSGNGGHLLIHIDLPNTADSTALVTRCLRTLDLYLSDEVVKIDTSVGNAARIGKLYGTVAAKGDDTPTRPHRLSRLLDVRDEIEIAPRDLLERIAGLGPQEEQASASLRSSRTDTFDLDAWIAEQGLVVTRKSPWQGGSKFVLETCAWNPDHADGAAFIVQLPSGAIGAGCLHDSCSGKGWRELREHLEPALSRRPTSTTPPRLVLDDSDSSARPTIVTTHRFTREITADSLAVIAEQPAPILFSRGTAVARLVGDPPAAEALTCRRTPRHAGSPRRFHINRREGQRTSREGAT